ncbi:MAG: T9SS type A sorting domain-containing protein [Candidatus Stahlbacteria bacterium]|nr:MAG: T9SS type A sorting domain-containing protein [Candidatus Stahlbacteria bacterium]
MKKALFCLIIVLPAIALSQVTEEWVARYNGPASGRDKAYAIAVDGSGNVYVTGGSEGSGTDLDYATVKYSSSGAQQWVARYNSPAIDFDVASAITVDNSGNVYVTGWSEASGEEDYDYATIKYNSAGEEQWVARYSVSADFDDVLRPTIAVDGSGNVYITATSQFEDTEYDYVTIKYNSAGIEQWVMRYNGPGNSFDYALDLALDGSGNVYVTGCSFGSGNSDYATIKYSQGPGIAEASVDAPEYLLEVTQLASEPVISYTLPVDTRISLKVYDVTGKLVKTLVSGSQSAGTHTIRWPVTHPKTPSGVYFVRLETSNRSATAKLVVAR